MTATQPISAQPGDVLHAWPIRRRCKGFGQEVEDNQATGLPFDYQALEDEPETTRHRTDDDGSPVAIALDPSEDELRISAELHHPWWCDRRRCSAWDGGSHHSDPELILPDQYSDIAVQVWLTHHHGPNEPVMGHAVIDLPWPDPGYPDERIVLTMHADRLTTIGEALMRAPALLLSRNG